jgi:UDP-N-acetylglucosamine 4,6-dehydratase
MTRFWITLQQGVNFVLSSLALMSGGEIFVPKIPSMKIVDVAKTLAPDLPQTVVGIRPGEKLHELMVTTDDARSTLELEDRYIIEPTLTFWSNAHLTGNGASLVAGDFEYASNINSEWLDGEHLLALIGQSGIG